MTLRLEGRRAPFSVDGVEPPTALPQLLIVDDSIDDQEFMRHLVQRAGFTHPIVAYADGESVIAGLTPYLSDTAEVPLFMFLDWKMPGMNGSDVIRWVRRHPRFAPLEIALLSGSLRYADMRLAAELGANHYFEKFPSTEVIRRCVQSASATRSSARARRGGIPTGSVKLGG